MKMRKRWFHHRVKFESKPKLPKEVFEGTEPGVVTGSEMSKGKKLKLPKNVKKFLKNSKFKPRAVITFRGIEPICESCKLNVEDTDGNINCEGSFFRDEEDLVKCDKHESKFWNPADDCPCHGEANGVKYECSHASGSCPSGDDYIACKKCHPCPGEDCTNCVNRDCPDRLVKRLMAGKWKYQCPGCYKWYVNLKRHTACKDGFDPKILEE